MSNLQPSTDEVCTPLIETCEQLIRNGRFSELDAALEKYAELIEKHVACRPPATFYRAVSLALGHDDYDSAQALLEAVAESEQANARLRARALNFQAMLIGQSHDQYSKALCVYQQSIDLCSAIGDPYGQAKALFNQAVIYNNRLYNPGRARALLHQAEKLLKGTEYLEDMVRILNEQGVYLLKQRCWTEARVVLEATLKLCVEQESQNLQAICEINLGDWERLQEHWTAAKSWYIRSLAFFEGQGGEPWSEAEVLLDLSQIARSEGYVAQAHIYLDRVFTLAEAHHNHHLVALVRHGQAQLANDQGQAEQALVLYWQAVHQVEQIRSLQEVSDIRLDVQAQWNAIYREAAACALRLNRIADAFLFSEHARARLLLETLGTPQLTGHPDAPDLLLELEQLRTSLHHLYAQDLGGQLDQAGRKKRQALESGIAEVRAQLSHYQQDGLPYQAPPTITEMQHAIPERAIVLSYFGTNDDLIVFAIDQHHVRQLQLPVSLTQIKNRLDQEGQIRDISPDRHTGHLSPYLDILHQLYRGLLAPISEWLFDYTTIYLVLDAELRHIPFHLLTVAPDQPCPLTADGRHLRYLPGASVLTRLPDSPSVGEFLTVGYNGANLHLMEAHVREVAHAVQEQSLCGVAANREAVMRAMCNARQIYFATHNLFRSPAAADCGLLLAEERLLTLMDIQQVRLPASHVILNGCQSSLVTERGGDWLGLTGAFLQAGASQVMGTLWDVSEVAACVLMDCFWRALGTVHAGDMDAALKQAQAEVRSFTLEEIREMFTSYDLSGPDRAHLEDQLVKLPEVSPDASHPLNHPYYWGAFVLVGG